MVRAVASVGELLNKVFEVHFADVQGWLEKNGRVVEFARRGNRFTLPVFVVGQDSPRYKNLSEDLLYGPNAGARIGPEAGRMELRPLEEEEP